MVEKRESGDEGGERVGRGKGREWEWRELGWGEGERGEGRRGRGRGKCRESVGKERKGGEKRSDDWEWTEREEGRGKEGEGEGGLGSRNTLSLLLGCAATWTRDLPNTSPQLDTCVLGYV